MKPETRFSELSARERVRALLDASSRQELLDPFKGFQSPWLESQGLVPQADDGIVAVRGRFDGTPALVIAIENRFEGGSIGEIGGAKIASALHLAEESSRQGADMPVVLLLETGGVRLQEANLGLAAIASIQAAILQLRQFVPVVAVIAGPVGCFGGMSLAACLCSTIIGTRNGRLGMNGPEVIEQEAGTAEFDASDKALVWKTVGCTARHNDGWIDVLVEDTVPELREAIRQALRNTRTVSERLRGAVQRLARARQSSPVSVLGDERASAQVSSQGHQWLDALAGNDIEPVKGSPSILSGEILLPMAEGAVSALGITVTPNPENHFPRARAGEFGLEEGWVLAEFLQSWVETEAIKGGRPKPIIAIVDTPGQAFGYREEKECISAACAAAIEGYGAARAAGHPVITLVVGGAFSGAYLAHGLQSDCILALNNGNVAMHAMRPAAMARVMRRSVREVMELTLSSPPMSFDIQQAYSLGLVDHILPIEAISGESVDEVRLALQQAIAKIWMHGPRQMALPRSQSSKRVWEAMQEQWRKRESTLSAQEISA